jgi:hypothetical protein
MTVVSEYKIVGFDPDRAPKVQRMPCIDLFFELNEEAPKEWCEAFNTIIGKPQYPVKIDPALGRHIVTWVRQSGEIEKVLERLKVAVADANAAYDKKMNTVVMKVSEDGTRTAVSPAQAQLDDIVTGLNFD